MVITNKTARACHGLRASGGRFLLRKLSAIPACMIQAATAATIPMTGTTERRKAPPKAHEGPASPEKKEGFEERPSSILVG